MNCLDANRVRLVTIFTLANSCLFPMFKRAKMHEVRRTASHSRDDARCASAEARANGDQTRRAIRVRSRRPSTTGGRQTRAHNSSGTKRDDELIERKSNLPNWDRSLLAYYMFCDTFCILAMLKYLVLCLLDAGTLPRDKYGHLDCLLVGRPTFNPRVVGLFKYACLCVYGFLSFYYSFMIGHKPPFRIHCLEFLLASPSEIEARLKKQNSDEEYCTLLSYENSFADDAIKTYHARPNRSMRAWRRLGQALTIWVGAIVGVYLIAIPLLHAVVLPMIVTRPGFEATYHVCLKWIAGQDRASSSWWRQEVIDVPRNYTFDPRLRNTILMSFSEQWVEFSAYHKVRVIWDILENMLFTSQIYLAIFVNMGPTLIISLDVTYYVRQIDASIKSFISDYHADMTRQQAKLRRESPGLPTTNIHDDFLWPQSLALYVQTRPLPECCMHEPARVRQQQYRERIARVQAMVVDLFSLLRDYNAYTVYYVTFCTFIWYTYSLICSSWLFMPSGRQESATMESFVIQTTVTLLFLAIMGAYSHAGHACCQLYKTISSATSLQNVDSADRERWIVIMKHFRPVPLHCFSIFRTSELSWMFVIKLSAWLLSTLFIFTSFSVNYGSFTPA